MVRPRPRTMPRLACAIVAFASLGLLFPGPAYGAGEVRLSAHAERCPLPSARTATPVGTGSCPGVRPGAFFSSPDGGCTFNFLFRGSDGYRYIGTAGHCLLPEGGETRWPLGKGPVVKDSGGRAVGRGAYAVLRSERDFALIRLNRSTKANPQMCHFGGPVKIDATYSASPVTLEHYGNGIGISVVAPGRTAVARRTQDPDIATALGAAAFGDSGSGVTLEGRAFGVLVALGFDGEGVILITRVGPQLDLAQKALGIKLKLLTARRL